MVYVLTCLGPSTHALLLTVGIVITTMQPPAKKSKQLSLFHYVPEARLPVTICPFGSKSVERRVCEASHEPGDQLPPGSALTDVSDGDSTSDHFVSEQDEPNVESTIADKHNSLILSATSEARYLLVYKWLA